MPDAINPANVAAPAGTGANKTMREVGNVTGSSQMPAKLFSVVAAATTTKTATARAMVK